jgi:hypothetical protein
MLKKTHLTLGLIAALLIFAQAGSVTVGVGGSTVTINRVPLSTVTFSMPGVTAVGGIATLNVSIMTTRRPPAAVQFDIIFPTATVTTITAVAGPVAIGAAKGITCNLVSVGLFRCLVAGLNATLIGDGVMAVVTATVTAPAQLILQNPAASSREASALNVAIAPGGGAISLPIAASALTCATPAYDSGLPPATYKLEPTEQLSCTVTLNQVAPVGFAAPIIGGAGISVPASVVFAAGQASGTFVITGQ